MIHVGDITKLNGATLEPVNCITGGSPCQDLSIAGKREGLAGERSGLFLEMVRVIKEMRQEDKKRGKTGINVRPRFVIWENVPGAFTSNGGEDFRCVLEQFSRVADETVIIPRPENGKWQPAGCIVGDNFSLAWRTFDAQYWGVPQRRKRIALVADFGGQCAAEILFEHEGLSGDITESGREGEGAASDAGAGIEKTSRAISFQERAGKPGGGKGILIQNERTGVLSTINNQSVCAFEPGAASRVGGHVYENKAGSLRANAGDNQQAVVYGISSYDSNAMKSDNPHSGIYKAETARTLDLNGGSPACNQGGMAVVCLEGNGSRPSHKGDGYAETDTMYTLNSTEKHAVAYRKQGHPQNAEQGQGWEKTETNDTLNAFDNGESRTPTVVLENHPQDSRVKISEDGVVQTLSKQMGTGGGNVPMVMEAIGGEVAGTLDTGSNAPDSNQGGVADYTALCVGNGQANQSVSDKAGALNTMHDPQAVLVPDVAHALKGKANCDFRADSETYPVQNSVVRRLTPLECERLQGYPDNWTDIGEWVDSKGKTRKPADAPRYKALGNSIALPQWQWTIDRMAAYLPEDATLGSLFDGIGGFPLCWERTHGKGTARWASEIEEFSMAVTKKHFPEEGCIP